jgi:hypothetical protein
MGGGASQSWVISASHSKATRIYMHRYTHTHTHTHTHMRTYIQTWYTYQTAEVLVNGGYAHTYIHTYTHTYMHAHTHTHMYAYIQTWYTYQTVEVLVNGGIAVMGHIGLTPQSYSTLGGFRAQGRHAKQAVELIENAKRLEGA